MFPIRFVVCTYNIWKNRRWPERGPIWPMQADVVDFVEGDISPSDHKPLMVTYRL